MKRFELFKRQLRSVSQRKPDKPSAPTRVYGENKFRSKGASLGLANTTPANFHPLFTRGLISRERHKLPLTATLAHRVDRHDVSAA